MRPRIGITGGIGSGKSVVARLLRIMEIPVYDADGQSKRLLNRSSELRAFLESLLGPEIYRNGLLDRELMASLIFSDSELLRRVSEVVHPAVGRHFLEWASMQTGSEACAIESAILFESGFHKIVDVSLLVTAPAELRIERVMSRDGSDRRQAEQRMSHQMPDAEKMKLADYLIVNDDIRAVIPQLENILSLIKDRFGLHNI